MLLVKLIEPPCTERYARWCERSGNHSDFPPTRSGVMIDRFGKDVSMIRLDDKRFVVNVEVAVSRQFLAWIIGLGEGITLAGPQNVVEMMNAEIDRLIKQYKK